MRTSCYSHAMANLQVKNIPESLHERLRRYATGNSRTISSLVLTAVERELERLEWREHMARIPETDLGVGAAVLLAEERSRRERELASSSQYLCVECARRSATDTLSEQSLRRMEGIDL